MSVETNAKTKRAQDPTTINKSVKYKITETYISFHTSTFRHLASDWHKFHKGHCLIARRKCAVVLMEWEWECEWVLQSVNCTWSYYNGRIYAPPYCLLNRNARPSNKFRKKRRSTCSHTLRARKYSHFLMRSLRSTQCRLSFMLHWRCATVTYSMLHIAVRQSSRFPHRLSAAHQLLKGKYRKPQKESLTQSTVYIIHVFSLYCCCCSNCYCCRCFGSPISVLATKCVQWRNWRQQPQQMWKLEKEKQQQQQISKYLVWNKSLSVTSATTTTTLWSWYLKLS